MFADDDGDDPSHVGAASNPLLEGIDQLNTMISFKDAMVQGLLGSSSILLLTLWEVVMV